MPARFSHLLRHPWAIALGELRLEYEPRLAVHAVGGTLRDAWLGRPPADFDVSLPDRGREIAERLASQSPRRPLGALRLVHLGREEFAAFRLVPITEPWIGDLDIWDRRGGSLAADLERRDLTAHALALDLESGEVVDPFGGRADLEARILRDVTPASFAGDPQRVVRLARFAAELPRFSVDPATLERASAAAGALNHVAPERVRMELERWGRLPEAIAGARVLVHLQPFAGLVAALPGLERLDAISRTAALEPDDRQAARWTILARACPGDLARWSDLQWWGRKAVEQARREAEPIPRRPADRREWLHERGTTWLRSAAAQLALSDDPAPQVTLAELHRIARAPRLFESRGFLSGEDLLEMGLPASPRIGEVLTELRRLEVRGDLTDRADALALARRLLGLS